MNDVSRVAAAMGWPKSVHIRTGEVRFRRAHGRNLPFDPENDATDDNAVLEWMREQPFWNDDRMEYYRGLPVGDYQVGNHFRAALKVMP